MFVCVPLSTAYMRLTVRMCCIHEAGVAFSNHMLHSLPRRCVHSSVRFRSQLYMRICLYACHSCCVYAIDCAYLCICAIYLCELFIVWLQHGIHLPSVAFIKQTLHSLITCCIHYPDVAFINQLDVAVNYICAYACMHATVCCVYAIECA